MQKNLASTHDYEQVAKTILNQTAFNYFADRPINFEANLK